ncbi:hypothetical protein [Geothrix campi]|uniref:hypothetical protein n=1 Tax=Geothrix campi TaxID=2966450 RepID=UPI002147FE1A|nr:hypothetical protein [Geothrix sp. SG10]
MRKIIQITDPQGKPVSGHIFEAPDAASLEVSMAGLPEGCWYEVEAEDQLVISPPPVLPDAPIA